MENTKRASYVHHELRDLSRSGWESTTQYESATSSDVPSTNTGNGHVEYENGNVRYRRHLRRKRLYNAGVIVITICIYPMSLKVGRMNPAGRRIQKQLERNSPRNATRLEGGDQCESPSLPASKGMHIIVGGYRRDEPGFGMKLNYLSDIGVTNADVYWYRRINPEVPEAEDQKLPCGITMHERFLSPNRGRDGAAFYDHILRVYDDPPEAVVFLHGHGAKSWHTSCDAIFGRMIYYYRDAAASLEEAKKAGGSNASSPSIATEKRVSNHIMTLTSSSRGTKHYQHKWFGQSAWKVQLQIDTPEIPISSPPLYFPSYLSPVYYSSTNKPCRDLLNRWRHIIPSHSRRNPYMSTSCCASFILPGRRIRRFPRKLYEELLGILTDEANDDLGVGRFCFEYIVFDLFHDDGLFEFRDVIKFYDEADALIHGKKRHSERIEPDESVKNRLGNCVAS
mmetsp:Transcript_37020/g.45263  ORF Transcript_37020/g.45263 Transcript_37020/m.45263 type:complete len:452 (-) Transcript_37020:213-1568(-)|eukprot:CAMPEP_0172506312 /NCGR_PEP_ID=MMETSP1066-20121228/193906_1 /TAXON_ID=671091 /ORGANISM="Coscinodiscus wailesii, Strain CCMP2513" /LENGTH=451 /DNA_ID=CAMNT_0013283291 /DNA_START=132 /DNA_END=1487 /DNA_ORIENTATION=-